MAIPTRIIKRRIKSIRSTGKIMKAMELVAASKMRKATQLVTGARPFADEIKKMTDELRQSIDASRYPFLVGMSSEKNLPSLLVIVASDRGLCGGFNSQLLKKTMEFVGSPPNRGGVRGGVGFQVVTIGRRAEQAVRRANLNLIASFESPSNAPSFEKIRPLFEYAIKQFLDEKVKSVYFAYTDFKSALTQVPMVEQVLPIIPEHESMKAREHESNEKEEEPATLIEPSPSELMNELLPKMVEMQSYRAILESAASEHAARMMAMRSAGDAASEMLDTLTFTLNQARQAAITQEISEISAGKAALE